MTNTLGPSVAIHLGLLGLVTGCATRKPVVVTQLSPLVVEAQQYVMALSTKLPLWEADTHYVIYERVELDRVKADIEVAKHATGEIEFLKDVAKLEEDWTALVALDDLLRHTSLA